MHSPRSRRSPGHWWRVAFLFLPLAWLIATPAAASPARLGPDLPYTVMADPVGDAGPDAMLPSLRQGAPRSGIFSRGYTCTVFWLRVVLPPARVADGFGPFMAALEGLSAWQEWHAAAMREMAILAADEVD